MKVCCIGAGAAGLACAKTLLEDEHEVTVFESREGIGGIWRLGDQEVSVRGDTIASSSKYYLAFSDYPMASHLPYFLHHSQYITYLEEYAREFGVIESIKFNSEVVTITQIGEKWKVKVRNGETVQEYTFDAVAVCTGLHKAKNSKKLENFAGDVFHAADVKDTKILKDKRVLVIGGGEGGAELAHVAAETSNKAAISLKRGLTVTPPYYPLPLHDIPDWMQAPHKVRPLDIHENRVHNLFSDKYKSALLGPDSSIFGMNKSNKGKYNAAYFIHHIMFFIGAPIAILLVTLISILKSIISAFSLFLKNMHTYLLLMGRVGLHTRHFWLSLYNKSLPFGKPDANELAKQIKKIQEENKDKNSNSSLSRDLSHVKAYMTRAKAYKNLGYSWDDYRRVRSELEYYTGSYHSANFYTKSDAFIYNIMDGSLCVFPVVERVDDHTVTFENGEKSDFDVIIACTGYKTDFPFLKEVDCDGRNFFKNVFHPGYTNLAFIGFARPELGAMPPIAELQSRWFTAVLNGKTILPGERKMKEKVTKEKDAYSKKNVFSGRLTFNVKFLSYMDEIAKYAGCYPDFRKLIIDPILLLAVMHGPMLPAHYRLNETGEKYSQIRRYIIDVYRKKR